MTTESRRYDRAPETEADRRFFDLREAGYRGPIDQDGNAVPDHAPEVPAGDDLARRVAEASDAGVCVSWQLVDTEVDEA